MTKLMDIADFEKLPQPDRQRILAAPIPPEEWNRAPAAERQAIMALRHRANLPRLPGDPGVYQAPKVTDAELDAMDPTDRIGFIRETVPVSRKPINPGPQRPAQRAKKFVEASNEQYDHMSNSDRVLYARAAQSNGYWPPLTHEERIAGLRD